MASTLSTSNGSRLLRWLPAVLWMSLIFFLSSWPSPSTPPGMATPGHALLYGVLGLTYLWALEDRGDGVRTAALAILLASAYGVTDEAHQYFVPGRQPDILDWAWDTVGAAAGVASGLFAMRVLARRPR